MASTTSEPGLTNEPGPGPVQRTGTVSAHRPGSPEDQQATMRNNADEANQRRDEEKRHAELRDARLSPGMLSVKGPYDDLLTGSDLYPGEECWILLSELGEPISVQRDTPEVGVLACRGRFNISDRHHALTSQTGAELTVPINPSTDLRFEGSSPEAYEASATKFREGRESGPRRTIGSDGTQGKDMGPSPQLAGAYENRPTHPQSMGQVAGVTDEQGRLMRQSVTTGQQVNQAGADKVAQERAAKAVADAKAAAAAKAAADAKAKADADAKAKADKKV
jgi:hypothetical protein